MRHQILGWRRNREAGIVLGCLLWTFSGIPAFADCPVVKNTATLLVRAPGGNLIIDTSGGSMVEIALSRTVIQVQEVCGTDTISVEGSVPGGLTESVDWKIRVPKSLNLDLTTNGGSITLIGDSDGEVKLRTSGGSVTAANIRRNALLYTQAGFIRAGNIGGNAELHSEGGNLEVGDVAGNASLETASGWIRAGSIGGSVKAETGGGSIKIKESRGDRFVATTKAGDISVTGTARKIDAQTEGGAITVGRARGAFQGRTESGDIRIDMATASIDAVSGFGDIFIRLDPDSYSGDLHVNIQTGNGTITFYLPETSRASIEAAVDKVAANARQPIVADFPITNSMPPLRS
ncbi:MAG TPA: DUF4097 family beta strand repeat-containing protein, partial [Terriglobia bacterium]|nr:DUF4097 family beta strand repeat-containing protein [Terriglobia bacterium]